MYKSKGPFGDKSKAVMISEESLFFPDFCQMIAFAMIMLRSLYKATRTSEMAIQ